MCRSHPGRSAGSPGISLAVGMPGRFVAVVGLSLGLLPGSASIPCARASGGESRAAVKPSAELAGAPEPSAVTSSPPEIVERWGVELRGVRLAAAGMMLDFRYRVVDPQKAAPLFVRQTKPVLIHEASGARLVVPRPPTTGPLRNSNTPQAGRTYFMFFGNPGRFVKAGQRVSVEIGAFKAEGLLVQGAE